MKYLKPLSPVLVGTSDSDFKRFGNQFNSTEYTATFGLITLCGDGSGEQLQGIYVTRSQLEQIRDEIDNYLQTTAEGEPKPGIADSLREPETMAVTSNFNVNVTRFSKEELFKFLLETAQQITETQGRQSTNTKQKQRLKINPELVTIEQTTEMPTMLYRASVSQWCNPGDGDRGSISLHALGESKEEARAILDAQFEALILRCTDTGVTKPEVPAVLNTTFNQQLDELKQKIQKDMSNPKIRAIMKAVTGHNWSEAPSATPNSNNSEETNTPTSEIKINKPQAEPEKSQVFKLNPNRVTSRIDPAIQSYSRWEARTTLYFGETPLEVVSSGHMTEESARTALDYKVGRLIDGMTD